MAVANAAPKIPISKYFIKRISRAMFTNAGMIMATMANFAFPSARMTLVPIMHNARKGTLMIIGK